MTSISIIIPAHNEENYIRQTLHSIKNQTYQDYEVIVVSNGCTDKTEEIMQKRVSDKIKHLSLPQPNVCRARNYGASSANGEILLFLDADTLLAEDALQKIKQEFAEKYSVATTRASSDEDLLKYKLAMKFKNFYNSTRIYKGCSGTLVCRKDDFDEVYGYDPELIVREHRKLTLKLLKLGKYGCIDTTVVNSMRRFNQWGLMKTAGFWLKQFLKDNFKDLKNSDYEKIR